MKTITASMEEVERVRKGIAPDEEQQKLILDAIDKHDGRLTQEEFDKVFGECSMKVLPNGETEVERHGNRPLRIWSHADEAIILGSLQQGHWARYLHLTQLMVVVGILKTEVEGDVDRPSVVYSRA